ncbi:MAG: hypothetical protein WCT08_05845 [Patescibacteria group bacterium]|jgi:hypothetical protein
MFPILSRVLGLLGLFGIGMLLISDLEGWFVRKAARTKEIQKYFRLWYLLNSFLIFLLLSNIEILIANRLWIGGFAIAAVVGLVLAGLFFQKKKRQFSKLVDVQISLELNCNLPT